MEEKKVLLSVKDLVVKFNVRGRILTAIRGISLDIHENESIAIVGESGSGKSVFTKTFAGMLDANGFIDNGEIIFNDDELVDTTVQMNQAAWQKVAAIQQKLNTFSALENGAETYNALIALKEEKEARSQLTPEEEKQLDSEISELVFQRTEAFNLKQTFDPVKEKEKIKSTAAQIAAFDEKIKQLQKGKQDAIARKKAEAKGDTAYLAQYEEKKSQLKERYAKEISGSITEEQ